MLDITTIWSYDIRKARPIGRAERRYDYDRF
nr:MAG TPA: hypothetical protein [Caudoviricetes sp.]DAW48492.1 MAG TPA: hypothetical protein [Caudoviricetes sp.]